MISRKFQLPSSFRSQWAAFIHDLIMIPSAWFLSYWLRVEHFPTSAYENLLVSLIIILPVQVASFLTFGLYRGIWRFASIPDIYRILKSVVVGVAISMALLFLATRGVGIPRSVPIIYAILLTAFLSGPRLLYRWIKDYHLYHKPNQRVLIVGGGKAGEMLARDILRNRADSYITVAFADDDAQRKGREIQGIPIVGTTSQIPEIVDSYHIDIIMLAIPSASSKQMRRIVEICESTGLPFRSVPQLKDLMRGNVQINEVRDVSIEDLLGREPISLDWPAISQSLRDKNVLVTGGGGSIGSELCRQIAQLNPTRLIILESSEFNLYSIQMELLREFPDVEIECHLGDITDYPFVQDIFLRHKPNIIFHAAAYKHVPLLEPHIRQALKNNVLGTRTIAEAANRHNVEVFVLVSTDKAVNPANVMGASKRVAEIFCQNLNTHSKTRYITVRFGNVLGSAGSVIPLFRKQIELGGPVTVTDPRMERYFMTIPEACQLIMQTVALGKGGEIFVLDMGDPVKISYLAEQMIRLSGRIPNEDIAIEYIGLRPGEKLYEELFHEKEHLEETTNSKVFLAQHRRVDWPLLNKSLDQIEVACKSFDTAKLKELLDSLVPEHRSTVDNGNERSQKAQVVEFKPSA
ncbi:MAG: nucleoside-diphosphate sugar epimerase/dehydratase [Candidatus Thiodiazotropha sp.]